MQSIVAVVIAMITVTEAAARSPMDAGIDGAKTGLGIALLMGIPFLAFLLIAWAWRTYQKRNGVPQRPVGALQMSNRDDEPQGVATTDGGPLAPPYLPDREANKAIRATDYQATFDEDHVYRQIAEELETDAIDKGLWTRLFAECGGDEKQTKVRYIKQRAERLISAERLRFEQTERDNAAEIERAERLRPPPSEAQQMEEHGITFSDERYIYGEYKYDKLSDAISYAKLQRKQPISLASHLAPSVTAQQKPGTFQNVIDDLSKCGYQAKQTASGWSIREPLGGRVTLKSDQALLDYAQGKVEIRIGKG